MAGPLESGTAQADGRLSVFFYPQERINPYFRILAGALERACGTIRFWRLGVTLPGGSIFHLHWPESVAGGRLSLRFAGVAHIALWRLVRTIRRTKREGGAVVWTAHNLRPHEAARGVRKRLLEHWLQRIYAELDAVICMSDASRAEIVRAFPILEGRTHLVRHPDYRTIYRGQAEAQRNHVRYGLPADTRVLVMAGLMRPYKQIEQGIALFRQIRRADEYLIVAGPCFMPSLAASITDLVGDDPFIRLDIAELSDADYEALVRNADASLILQERLLNSGAIIASLSLETPIVAIDVPATREIADLVGGGWIATIPELTGPALRGAIDTALADRDEAPDMRDFDPDTVAALHLALYRKLLKSRG